MSLSHVVSANSDNVKQYLKILEGAIPHVQLNVSLQSIVCLCLLDPRWIHTRIYNPQPWGSVARNHINLYISIFRSPPGISCATVKTLDEESQHFWTERPLQGYGGLSEHLHQGIYNEAFGSPNSSPCPDSTSPSKGHAGGATWCHASTFCAKASTATRWEPRNTGAAHCRASPAWRTA